MSEQEILEKGKENKAKLLASNFRQQTLPWWRPNSTIVGTLIIFIIFGIIFLSLGIILVLIASSIKEAKVTYHDQWENMGTCTVTLEVKEKMSQPIHVYYELENFYQNHRRFVKSTSSSQLAGSVLSVDKLSSWDPIRTIKDLGFNKMLNNETLDDDQPANPCGLVARSFFNDTYKLFLEAEQIDIDEKGIAWKSDRDDLFKRPDNHEAIQWIDVKNEHFIVWMRTAGFPTFKKPWGKIERDLEPGNYTLIIENNYNVDSFDGK